MRQVRLPVPLLLFIHFGAAALEMAEGNLQQTVDSDRQIDLEHAFSIRMKYVHQINEPRKNAKTLSMIIGPNFLHFGKRFSFRLRHVDKE